MARSPRYPDRLQPPATVAGHGEDEVAAITDRSGSTSCATSSGGCLEEKERAAYLQGAEEQSRATLGRPPTPDELERVLKRYPREA